MNLFTMLTAVSLALSTSVSASIGNEEQPIIGKTSMTLKNDRMTPEVLWSMGRIGSFTVAQNGKHAVYSVAYYSVPENKSHHVLYLMDMQNKKSIQLTTSKANETNACFIKKDSKIAFLSNAEGSNQLWEMDLDGSNHKQLSKEDKDIADYKFSPDEQKVILIKEVETTSSINAKYKDLPKASGMVITDLMYKHWDQYVTSIPHPFVATFDGNEITNSYDILDGEPFECPMLPFGGTEQLAWSPDSKYIAYTCRKKTGKDYAISTDSDIFLYELSSKKISNLCKPTGYKAPAIDPTKSLQEQAVNRTNGIDCNVGYDTNPQFSPDGKLVAWLSMERDGYESDRTRLCIYNRQTGKKSYVTESFESGVDEFCWLPNSKELYFTGVWHGATMIYRTNMKGEIAQLTNGHYNYSLLGLDRDGKKIFAKRHNMSQADEIYRITPKQKNEIIEQLTFENKHIYDQLTMGEVKERWVKTVDGKEEQCWVIYPPHFDPKKKYPTLLFCEGGPQSPVTQFWSYRWNFQIMAANDYIIIAPNRRGLPGYGMEWLEQISGDYTGLCMQDYLSAIDDISKEPYIDKDHLGCVGASFGGFSVYWLAGHHNKRFKCFISHDGIYNTQQQYVETEELWFPNWDLKSAPWIKQDGKMQKAYEESPHLYVDKWDSPILCIHGQKDFRIEYTQAESAFTAAKMRGIPAELLLFPDENHWVLKPQNGVLWQRTFFNWLNRWLKPEKK